jgi:hypothetical protein
MTTAAWIRAFVAASTVLTFGFLATTPAEAQSATITVLMGGKDGFGGTQKCNPCAPGDPFSVISSSVILPGVYVNRGFDATTVEPGKPYVFEFDFKYNTSGLAEITSATVTVRSGSVSRRSTENNGFGFAAVTADGGSGRVSLGQFWMMSTGSTAGAPKESIKDHVFNVLPVMSTSGVLKFVIDGSALADSDQFSIDYAELTIRGIERETGKVMVAGNTPQTTGK